MKFNKIIAVAALAVSGMLVASCSRQVTRVSTDETIDISGNWNNSDSRLVAADLTDKILNAAWINTHLEEHQGKRPVVIVGFVQNKSHEHI